MAAPIPVCGWAGAGVRPSRSPRHHHWAKIGAAHLQYEEFEGIERWS